MDALSGIAAEGAGSVAHGFELTDFRHHFVIAPGEESAAADDHVDLVGAIAHGLLGVGDTDGERVLAGGEAGGDGRDLDVVVADGREGFAGDADHGGIDADGGDAGEILARGVGAHGLLAEGSDLFGGVFAFEGGEVDHREREPGPASLAEVLMDRVLNDAALLGHDGIDGAGGLRGLVGVGGPCA